MALSKPTDEAYRWCTTTANRTTPTPAQRSIGFEGGKPVPAGENNGIFGVLSDWVAYAQDRWSQVNSTVTHKVPLGTLGRGDIAPAISVSGPSGNPFGAALNISRSASMHYAPESAVWGYMAEGGRLAGVAVSMAYSSGGHSATARVAVYSSNGGAVLAVYEGAAPGSFNNVTLTDVTPGGAMQSEGPVWVVIAYEFDSTGHSGAEEGVIAPPTLTWSAT